jgi:Outer membrane protein beta-barrel domain
MKNFLFFLSMLCVPLFAQNHFYIKPSMGMNWTKPYDSRLNFKSGKHARLSLGKEFYSIYSAEVECDFFYQRIGSIRVPETDLPCHLNFSNLLISSNITTHLPGNRLFTPYIGLGVGRIFHNDVNHSEFIYKNKKEIVFLLNKRGKSSYFQTISGVKMSLFDSIEYFLEHRRIHSPNNFSNHSVSLGFYHYF